MGFSLITACCTSVLLVPCKGGCLPAVSGSDSPIAGAPLIIIKKKYIYVFFTAHAQLLDIMAFIYGNVRDVGRLGCDYSVHSCLAASKYLSTAQKINTHPTTQLLPLPKKPLSRVRCCAYKSRGSIHGGEWKWLAPSYACQLSM